MPQKNEDVKMPFGKHAGKTLSEILAEDPSYLDWLADADIYSTNLRNAVEYMNKTYAAEIERALDD